MLMFCLLPFFVVCSLSVPSVSSCQVDEYEASDGSCLVVLKNVGPPKKSRIISAKLCEEYGDEYGAYRLPTIKDAQKHNSLLQWLRNLSDNPTGSFRIWLDMMRDVRNSNGPNWGNRSYWRWHDDHSVVTETMWATWTSGEPNNFNEPEYNNTCGRSDEHCVLETIDFSANTFQWADARCHLCGEWAFSKPWLLVCEKRASKQKKEPLSEAAIEELKRDLVQTEEKIVGGLPALDIVRALEEVENSPILENSLSTVTQAPRSIDIMNKPNAESVAVSAQAASATPPPAAPSSGAAVTVLVLMYILGICLVSGGGYLVYQGRRRGVQNVGFSGIGRYPRNLNNDTETNGRL